MESPNITEDEKKQAYRLLGLTYIAQDYLEEAALRKSPKTINVRINKKSGDFKMDRLDGFVLVLEGESGKYQSTPILTDGNRGAAKFSTPIPVGDYKLDMSIFSLTTTVSVQEFPKKSLSMIMDVSRSGIKITLE